MRGPGPLTVLRTQLDELWTEDPINWDLVGDASASARSIGILELADALLQAYNDREPKLLWQILLPAPADMLTDVEPSWVVDLDIHQPIRNRHLLHVQEDFRFEWFQYLTDTEPPMPRHQILISYETEHYWPTLNDVARGFDHRRSDALDVFMLDDKIGMMKFNTISNRNHLEFYPKPLHLWYDINAWQRLHDMFVQTWRNVSQTFRIDFNVDDAIYVGDEEDGVYYQVEQGPRGWYVTTVVDSNTGGFVDTLEDTAGPFATQAEAMLHGRDVAVGWGFDNQVEFDEPETEQ